MKITTHPPRPTILTDQQTDIVEIVNFAIISSSICLFGIIANIINIVIFFKQGFTNTVNINLFGIAISDLGCLITLEWICISLNPLFGHSGILFQPIEIMYVSGGMFCVAFSRITGWITAFVTIERCLSITIPLKVKQIITPRRTTVSLIIIFIANIFAFAPEYFITRLSWKFYPKQNISLIGVAYIENPGAAVELIFVLTILLGLLCFVIVIVFTAILVYKLKQNSKWRRTVTSDANNSGAISGRDKKTMKMIVTISSVLVICYTPGVIVAFGSVLEPEFKILGHYYNMYIVMWSFPFIFQAINSSINIFFYYRMSSNYRQTFDQIFSPLKAKISRKVSI